MIKPTFILLSLIIAASTLCSDQIRNITLPPALQAVIIKAAEEVKQTAQQAAAAETKRIPCKECGRQISPGNFNQHVRIHGPKFYPCHYCLKAFSRTTTRNDHEQKFHPQNT